MKFPHPIRARRERRMEETVQIATVYSGALARVLRDARPKVEYTVRHAPRPKPNQIQIKGILRDGQQVYIDAIALHGQRSWCVPMRAWLVEGNNPLDHLDFIFDYPDS